MLILKLLHHPSLCHFAVAGVIPVTVFSDISLCSEIKIIMWNKYLQVKKNVRNDGELLFQRKRRVHRIRATVQPKGGGTPCLVVCVSQPCSKFSSYLCTAILSASVSRSRLMQADSSCSVGEGFGAPSPSSTSETVKYDTGRSQRG